MIQYAFIYAQPTQSRVYDAAAAAVSNFASALQTTIRSRSNTELARCDGRIIRNLPKLVPVYMT